MKKIIIKNIYKEIKIYNIIIMSGYIVEEPNDIPIYINEKDEVHDMYYKLYSPLQKKRFMKVLSQLKNIWFNVYQTLDFVRNTITIEESNNLMMKIHKMFIIRLKDEIEYYNDEKIRLRKNKNYLSKKINKLKSSKKII